MNADTMMNAGALPRMGGFPSRGFVAHAVIAMLLVIALNLLVTLWVPFWIKGIGASYLIFFYHFPSAINLFLFYAGVAGASALYLKTKNPVWDVRARAAAEIGVLANAVLLLTGATWAKAAWNAWWIWDDPRLMSAAVMSLTYVGYLFLQSAVEEPDKRRQVSAVFGILAFVNVPIVHFSIKWFGTTSHPLKFDGLGSDPRIVATRWIGVFVFFVFYLLLYRLDFDRKAVAERSDVLLARVRRIEESGGNKS